YFDRHDGQAVTTEDFLKAMEDANEEDLSQMQRWYDQAGTPVLRVEDHYDTSTQTYTLNISQSTPATPECSEKQPFLIPIKFGLLDSAGNDMEVDADTLVFSENQQEFVFEGVSEKPLPSLLRGFSAPVKLEYDYSFDDYLFLMKHDSDDFNRFEAGQQFILSIILQMIQNDDDSGVQKLLDALAYILSDTELSYGMKARMLSLPTQAEIGGALGENLAYDVIHHVRECLQKTIADHFEDEMMTLYDALSQDIGDYRVVSEDIQKRSLKNTLLSYMTYLDTGKRAYTQYKSANNMTDTASALKDIVHTDAAEKTEVLSDFIDKWKHDTNVVDKWFSVQAMSPTTTAADIQTLMQHELFDIKNPNKLRSVIAAFAVNNYLNFHAPDGSGYVVVADAVIEVSRFNSQIAGRLVKTMMKWRELEPKRSKLLRNELVRVSETPDLASDVAEIVEKSL
ncbi:DUF3458 domain-containing protein, partial [Candidatus Gracilibacteria bacterium]|nr:DUF3458 domain-containing protein [Candidatus Gracilibacteria bacterium]